MKRKVLLLLVMGTVMLQPIFAQNRPTPAPGDTTANPNAPGRTGRTAAPRPYNEVIPGRAVTQAGLFKVHKVDERYFFEIHDSLLNRDILVVNRISKAAAGGRAGFSGYAGDQIGDNVIQFEKGPNNKLFLKSISYLEMARDTTPDGMYRSVMNSNLQPIAASFDIRAFNRDAGSTVIDITDYISSDNDILFFDARAKRSLSLGSLQADRSYIGDVKSFPMNVEIRTVKTYTKTPPTPTPGQPQGPGGGAAASPGPATYELNSSIVLLPRVPMQPRYFDPRVGYFSTGFVDFDANPQGVKRISMITRWRLEPKPEDVERYKRGELVEPRKPIVFYIDPATPRKWIPYLIQGVDDWQVAFEKAGFKNAIYAKEAPGNPDWSLEDARHSAIVYKPSDIPNASGPHVHDPRSGEIIETHINWYHNVMLLLRNWYFIQTAAVDPRARKMRFEDSLMGQLIRFVSSHEVGHTLGLRHNFGSSSTVPVEKLRDKKFVEEHGHTPSIMDYARFNYVAQPEDNISDKGLFPRIGDYDIWAIEWGYRWFPEFNSPVAEKAHLNKWIVDRIGKNPRLWFGTETDPNDPRGQNEDLGDNAMLASGYGIKNLKRIVPNILEWTKENNEGYENAQIIYNQVVSQFSRYMGHVAKNIGGISTTPKTVEEAGAVYEFVPKATQKEAMVFLDQQIFKTPEWLIDKKLYAVSQVSGPATISTVQQSVLTRLLSNSTLTKLLEAQAFNGSDAYTATEFVSDLKRSVWSEVATRRPIDIYRRNLQKIYVERLATLLNPPAASVGAAGGNPFAQQTGLSKLNDAISILKGHARSLGSEIRTALPSITDTVTRYHLQDVLDRLNEALDPKN